MKKTICLFSLILVCFVCSAFGEEFEIRNGVSFGMSKETIIEIENDNGVKLETWDLTGYAGEGEDCLKAEDATLPYVGKSRLSYTFDNDKMYEVWYLSRAGKSLTHDSYDELCSALSDKYGSPVYQNQCGTYNEEQFVHERFYLFVDDSPSGSELSMWLVDCGDSAVEIDCMFMAPHRPFEKNPTVYMKYILITSEEYDTKMSVLNQKKDIL